VPYFFLEASNSIDRELSMALQGWCKAGLQLVLQIVNYTNE